MEPPKTLEDKKHIYTENERHFINFLNEYRIKKGKASHTGIGWCTGKFFIEGNNLIKFYSLYAKLMQEKSEISLIEQHSDMGPIIIDIDLRFDMDMRKRVFSASFVKIIVKEYIKQILDFFELPEGKRNDLLQAFIFERPEPYEFNNQIKDGIHIMFPFIVSEPYVQHIIRENVIKALESHFKTIPTKNTISDAIDNSVISKNGWMMYGSTKPNVAMYKLVHIYDQNLNGIDVKKYNDYELPALLSIRGKTELTPLKQTRISEIDDYAFKKNQKKIARKKASQLTKEDIEDIYELVNILDSSRADNYEEWINIGFALHSIEPDNEDLLSIWDNFSQQSKKYEPKACEKKWNSCMDDKPDGLTLATIHYWAKKDNPEKYKEFQNGQLRTYIEQSLSGCHVDIAKVVYRMFKYLYVCAGKGLKWYFFDKHRWVEDESGLGLRTRVSNELVDEYVKLISYLNEKISIAEDESMNETDKKRKFEIESRIKQMESKVLLLFDITKKLKTTTFIDNVMKECKGLFYDKNFLMKLDENHFLFLFKNGVLDLKTGEFREGRPNDYISLCAGVNYVPYSDNLPFLPDVLDFLEKVQPKANLRKYMLSMLSSCLEGHNADENFHLWTGSGGNGKSKVNQLLVEGLGEYSCKFPITLFTGKRGASNSVSPEVVESKGKRYVYLEEPGDNERINIGLMKEYTGGDKIKGRGLFSNFIEFKPQFKVILFCNDMPKVPAEDNGTWRRVKVLEFTSCFKENPKNENEFPIDKYLGEKIPKWGETFMSLLVHNYFTSYKASGGLFVPEDVLKFTEEYQKDMDTYVDFINMTLTKTDNKNDKLSLQSIHNEFKEWFKTTYNCTRHPLKREMKKYFEKRYGKKWVSGDYIIGFIKNQQDNEENEE